MKVFHIVKTYFARWTEKVTQEWLEQRYQFFANHTLRSLQLQTLKDWRLWCCCCPGDMEGRIANLRAVCPDGTWFTFREGPRDQHPLRAPEISSADWDAIGKADYVYITRIDSDDLYSPDALAIANQVVPTNPDKIEASCFGIGYSYEMSSRTTGVHRNWPTPFHTVMIPRDIFMNEERYHANIINDFTKLGAYNLIRLPDWKFCVLVHGHNYGSNFQYRRDIRPPIEKGWSPEFFLARPIVFDLDDFCDEWFCLPELDRLKKVYPNFKCTLFTIPAKTSKSVLDELMKRRDWIEIAVHGIKHEPNEEMKHVKYSQLMNSFDRLDHGVYHPGFRPPGWFLSEDCIRACNDFGLWIALHERDQSRGHKCEHGYYYCGARLPYWHGHTRNVCDNWIRAHLPELEKKWPTDQKFAFVSEAVLVPQSKQGRFK